MKILNAMIAAWIGLAMAWTASAQESESEQQWIQLFNGKDLTGWTQKNGTAKYTIEEGGVICGTTAEGSPNSFLCTDQEFANFELEFDVKVDQQLNSGVQIRSIAKPQGGGKWGRVNGPQVEIEASGEKGAEAGYVYGEATGRGWLVPKDKLIPHKKFKDGQWNHYRVVARGPRFQTYINDQAGDRLDRREDL